MTLAAIKLLDNMIGTARNITTYKNKMILTTILVMINQFIFYFIIAEVLADSSVVSTVTVCIASGAGTMVAFLINNKLKRDESWMNILTCSRTESTEELYQYLLDNNIHAVCMDTTGKDGEPTKTVMAFAETKYESSLIDKYIKTSKVRYLRKIRR